MAHEDESQYSGNDHLRARFTMWLNTTLIRARTRYLETHTQTQFAHGSLVVRDLPPPVAP